jgi:hypothetical protein
MQHQIRNDVRSKDVYERICTNSRHTVSRINLDALSHSDARRETRSPLGYWSDAGGGRFDLNGLMVI